ncbi:MAG: (E)-4-hydroxy-3-methylbut-2-enyl-diphosphate synthase (flavodoxin) [Firmicutes bacterium]|nr:(E)-4-hydroxy-3-methylbut-2-enyl-diphosphate synthase (flavodoxin) [Bacillota bacterium]MDI6704711.1 flavodoxin-dependent (E)-4-hydroxy-3-methylbut-2-enyl-diphosphate synthase [Bacillota bacterium]
MRRKSRLIHVGGVPVGGLSPVTVQSMTNTKTSDIKATVDQIRRLQDAGCDIVRIAVPDKSAANAIKDIVRMVQIPVIADIHYDYNLAIQAIENGVSGLRINPGNIGSTSRVEKIVKAAKHSDIPIRIGVNSGSLEKDILDKYGQASAEALVESALRHVSILEKLGFYQIKISLKASEVLNCVKAYRIIADKVDYPLHLGVTEAGTFTAGTVKSSIGIGSLLMEGIGDTIRVSLTDDPVKEVEVGKEILRAVGLYNEGVEVISCPTCGRCEIELVKIAQEVNDAVRGIKKPLKVAVMGCAVNGPGEAKNADLGIAGGKGKGLIFKNGMIIRRVKEGELVSALLEEIDKY